MRNDWRLYTTHEGISSIRNPELDEKNYYRMKVFMKKYKRIFIIVRVLTGTLIEVGRGKRKPEEMQEIIKAQDRGAAGFTAPAQGLFLVEVEYI